MIEVVHLIPALWRWFINIAWVRYITGRRAPEVPVPEAIGTPNTEFPDEEKGVYDDEPSYTDELPLLEKTEKHDYSDETTEYGELQIPRFYSAAVPCMPTDPPTPAFRLPWGEQYFRTPHLYRPSVFKPKRHLIFVL